MNRTDAAATLLAALRDGSTEAFSALERELAPNAFIMAPQRDEASGRDAVLESLRAAQAAGTFAAAKEWEGPKEEERGVRLTAKTPGGLFPGITWLLTFDPEGQIAKILESRLRAGPQPPQPLRLTEAMKAAVNGAMDNGTPTILGYSGEDGKPHLSFRGTTQAFSDDQLAVWARYEDAGLPTAVQKNPYVSVVYYAKGQGNLIFEGRARIESDPVLRDRIFDNSSVLEQRADPERNGVAIVIDVDKVTGRLAGERLNMARTAG
ncbi:MAG: hypothetical protein JO247_09935 [Chloroflexi bacterium]|nr:hypothetical protein [Chloroflexota bacterium]